MPRPSAVVLMNLGGPDSLDAVEPFLCNLFSDPRIMPVPLGARPRRLLARLIARRRAREARAIYRALGGRSPLVENTERQAAALARALGEGFELHVCMRYWHPMAAEVAARLQARGRDDVILLPLYPQYSETTTGSAVAAWRQACAALGYRPRLRVIGPWYDNALYQEAVVACIREAAAGFPDPEPARIELLASAHGLPQRLVRAGDPYARQVQATFEAVRARLGWPRCTLCYQSRVGPLAWLRPYTEEVIREKARAGAEQMLVYPLSFVSDHSETLYELGVLYARLAGDAGVTHYRVVPALNDHPLFIEALAGLVRAGAEAPGARAAAGTLS